MTERENRHPNSSHGPVKRYAVGAAKFAGWAILLALLIHVAWNMFAPDLFDLPAMRMKQALGLALFTTVIGVLLRPFRRHPAAETP